MPDASYPGRAPIDAYGNGGFRFAGMSHRGSLLIVPSGIYAWDPGDFAAISAASFDRVFAEASALDFVLLGTGLEQRSPSPAIRAAFEGAGVGLEVMDTGAACRTFNVLLGEERAVGAALIAVG